MYCSRSPYCTPFSTRTSWCWWLKFSHRLDEPDRGEALRVERLVIAAAQVAVGAVDHQPAQAGRVRVARLLGEARELARGRVVLAADHVHAVRIGAGRQRFGEDAHVVVALDAVVADRRADDVVVHVPFDVRAGVLERLGEVRAAEEPLLLGVEAREHDGRVQRHVRQHARRLDDGRRPRAVVVGARRVVRRRRRCWSCASRSGSTSRTCARTVRRL